uniref:Chemokine (C-C motif) receptor 9b n=1 Tax=Hucho hucho TaxID=62062 RepID=A0A4W5MGL1_9TELE
LALSEDYTEDYETFNETPGGLCDKSWVKDFRGLYEPPLFCLIFVLGAVGNLMVVFIFTMVRHRLKTMTDVYLLNLAVADLLFLGTLPFWAADATKGWMFGLSLCKLISAIYKINFFSSMLLLTCISLDRYVAIVKVAKAHNQKNKRLSVSKLTCLAVWIISGLLALPELIFILVLALQICVGFFLPLLVMVLCYSVIIRTLLQAKSFEKHKALRVIFAVVAVFVLSQLPYNGLLVVDATQAADTTITDCAVLGHFDVAGQIAKSLAYTHACINPFLYVFIGVRFQKDLLRLLKLCTCGLSQGGVSKLQAFLSEQNASSWGSSSQPPFFS